MADLKLLKKRNPVPVRTHLFHFLCQLRFIGCFFLKFSTSIAACFVNSLLYQMIFTSPKVGFSQGNSTLMFFVYLPTSSQIHLPLMWSSWAISFVCTIISPVHPLRMRSFPNGISCSHLATSACTVTSRGRSFAAFAWWKWTGQEDSAAVAKWLATALLPVRERTGLTIKWCADNLQGYGANHPRSTALCTLLFFLFFFFFFFFSFFLFMFHSSLPINFSITPPPIISHFPSFSDLYLWLCCVSFLIYTIGLQELSGHLHPSLSFSPSFFFIFFPFFFLFLFRSLSPLLSSLPLTHTLFLFLPWFDLYFSIQSPGQIPP